MLELKGELVFKTVAYHRAADAIGRSPVDIVAAYRAGTAAADPGRRQGDQRQARGAGHDRPHGVPRAAARGDPAEPGGAAADPGPRAQDRPPAAPASSASRRSTTCASAAEAGRLRTLAGMSARTEALVLEGIARLERPVRPDAARPGRGLRRRADRGLLARRPASAAIEPAGSFRRRQGSRSATSTSSPRRTSRPALDRGVHDARARSTGRQPGSAQGGRPAACAGRRST